MSNVNKHNVLTSVEKVSDEFVEIFKGETFTL